MDKKMVLFFSLCLGIIFLFACNVAKTGKGIAGEQTQTSPRPSPECTSDADCPDEKIKDGTEDNDPFDDCNDNEYQLYFVYKGKCGDNGGCVTEDEPTLERGEWLGRVPARIGQPCKTAIDRKYGICEVQISRVGKQIGVCVAFSDECKEDLECRYNCIRCIDKQCKLVTEDYCVKISEELTINCEKFEFKYACDQWEDHCDWVDC